MAKVITVQWEYMTNTKVYPFLTKGRILSATAYGKGQGNRWGRFPVLYLVCTDDAVVEHHRFGGGLGQLNPELEPFRLKFTSNGVEGNGFNPVKIVDFRDSCKAEEVANEWAKGRSK